MTNIDHLITIQIMDRNYHIKCPPEEAAQLQESARYLDQKMRVICESAQTNSVERLAIVSALNVIQELMAFKTQKNSYIGVMHDQIKSLQGRIQQFLNAKEEAMA